MTAPVAPASVPRRRWIGHAAALAAYVIFGFNIVVCKDLTGQRLLSPAGIFFIRSVGAGAIFWLLSLAMPAQRVPRRDLARIFMASLLGFFLTQLTFLMAIPLISPMESSIMSSLTPVYTMLVAAVAVREPLTWKKAAGVALSLGGVLYLIITGMQGGAASGDVSVWGLLLMCGNALFFAMYLGIFRPVIERYTVVTFMKWIFLFSTLMSLPLAAPDLARAPLSRFPALWLWELAYLVVMATFVAYFLIPLAQKHVRPTVVSLYSYAQPLVAIGISIWAGLERLTVVKVMAAAMVFVGVWVVSRSRAAAPSVADKTGEHH